MVLIIVAIGAMVVIGLLGYATSVLRAGGSDADTLIELYAAEAGIAEVKTRLLGGELIPLPHSLDSLEVDGLTVHVSIADPIRALTNSSADFIDPNVGVLTQGEPYRLTVDLIAPGSSLAIHWAYTPTSTLSHITVYKGRGRRAEDIVATSTALASPNDLPGTQQGGDTITLDGGTYTFEFVTTAASGLRSVRFANIGDPNLSRLSLSAHKDYVVTSRAGDTTVTAYLRQIPGPTIPPVPQRVYTLSWKPYE
jgi:hypothetical protein